MTPAQKLAPMQRWATDCESRGMTSEARALIIVNTVLSTEDNPQRSARDWARVYLYDFHGRSPTGWAYAIACVLLNGEP